MPDHDNPYAAPQTIGTPAPQMALSADAERLRFTEYSTKRLKQLLDYSYALQQMHLIWILFAVLITLCLLFIVAVLVSQRLDFTVFEITVGLAVFIYLRVAAGYSRKKPARVFAIACDGLLAVGCLWLIGVLLSQGSIVLPIVCGFVVLHAAASFLTHHHARELFGSRLLDRDELAAEVAYREQNGVA